MLFRDRERNGRFLKKASSVSEIAVVPTFDFSVELIMFFALANHFFVSFFLQVELGLMWLLDQVTLAKLSLAGVYFIRGNIWVSPDRRS